MMEFKKQKIFQDNFSEKYKHKIWPIDLILISRKLDML